MKKTDHKYLLSIYNRVDELLSRENLKKEDLPDLIVYFCTVIEKILKIKLYNKNPFLVFELSSIGTENLISRLATKKDVELNTLRVGNVLDRFAMIFKKTLNPSEIETIKEIYKLRNFYIHGYKEDNKIVGLDVEKVVNQMGTIWERINKITVSLFGKENIKNSRPKKTYTEKEFEKAFEDEVGKMITPKREFGLVTAYTTIPLVDRYNLVQRVGNLIDPITQQPISFNYFGERCPRCNSSNFSLTGNELYSYVQVPKLYKCEDCHLELTEKQYEIAKKIKKSNT